MDFKTALRTAQEKNGWTHTQVAVAAGVSESAVKKWAAGENEPRYRHIQALKKNMPFLADLVDGRAAA